MLFKRVVAFTLIITLVTAIININSSVQAKSVEKVRIGLYYAGTACSYANVNTLDGLEIGNIFEGEYKILMKDSSGQLIVRKDAWYYKVNGSLKEYKPGTKVDGLKQGPYHLKLLSGFSNSIDAIKKVQEFKLKGVPAYPAYTGQWEIWVGHYTSFEEASADIVKYRQNSSSAISVVGQPIGHYNPNIVIEKSDGSTLFLYARATGYLQLAPTEANIPRIIKINGRNYRGALEFRRQEGSDMTVINHIDVDDYLYGVVPSEIESYSPVEALKSQALVARNYTYCNLNKFAKWGFDLDTTVQSQVYKGYDGEAASTNKAVDETRGMVLKDGDKLAQCFYFSSSGGRTEDVRNVWGSTIPYLKSVEDPYESGKSSRYYWEKTLTAQKVKEIMESRGYAIGEIEGLEVTKRSDTGRAIELKVIGTKGESTFYREACRTVLGLDSQWFSITTDSHTFVASNSQTTTSQITGSKAVTSDGNIIDIKGNGGKVSVVGAMGKTVQLTASRPTKFIIQGKGYGHAVGLSQEGTKGFAGTGRKFNEILLHYFPGTRIDVVG